MVFSRVSHLHEPSIYSKHHCYLRRAMLQATRLKQPIAESSFSIQELSFLIQAKSMFTQQGHRKVRFVSFLATKFLRRQRYVKKSNFISEFSIQKVWPFPRSFPLFPTRQSSQKMQNPKPFQPTWTVPYLAKNDSNVIQSTENLVKIVYMRN